MPDRLLSAAANTPRRWANLPLTQINYTHYLVN